MRSWSATTHELEFKGGPLDGEVVVKPGRPPLRIEWGLPDGPWNGDPAVRRELGVKGWYEVRRYADRRRYTAFWEEA